jgi:nitrogen fixation NifU-like protein
MTDNPEQELYHKLIMRHNRDPFHFAKREDASLVVEAYNPLCGDQFKLYLEIVEKRVVAAHFHGYGCAVSKASTSVLMEKIQGLPWKEAQALAARFTSALEAPDEDAFFLREDPAFAAFSAVRRYPSRLRCVTLSWEALEKTNLAVD